MKIQFNKEMFKRTSTWVNLVGIGAGLVLTLAPQMGWTGTPLLVATVVNAVCQSFSVINK